MAWNPSPEIAALRDYSKRFDRPVVVAFSLDPDGARFHITTYGKTRTLCGLAAEFGREIAEAVKQGDIAPPELEPLAAEEPAQMWERVRHKTASGEIVSLFEQNNAALRAAIDNAGLDISPCRACGEPVVCVPDGMGAMCAECVGDDRD